jgi:hypothetical protein
MTLKTLVEIVISLVEAGVEIAIALVEAFADAFWPTATPGQPPDAHAPGSSTSTTSHSVPSPRMSM